jgi:hypothetical protein
MEFKREKLSGNMDIDSGIIFTCILQEVSCENENFTECCESCDRIEKIISLFERF